MQVGAKDLRAGIAVGQEFSATAYLMDRREIVSALMQLPLVQLPLVQLMRLAQLLACRFAGMRRRNWYPYGGHCIRIQRDRVALCTNADWCRLVQNAAVIMPCTISDSIGGLRTVR